MAISPEQLQQAIQQAVATAAQLWHEERRHRCNKRFGTLRAQVQDAAQAAPLPREMTTSLVDTRLLGKPESFDGGTGWKDWSVVFRSYACACSAPLGLLLERTERLAGPMLNATSQSEASCSTQLYYILVMSCLSTRGPGGMAMLFPASRTDFTDTQCGFVARALELQLRGRDSGSNGTVRPRHLPIRESERRDVPREHPYRRCSSHVADGWIFKTTPRG